MKRIISNELALMDELTKVINVKKNFLSSNTGTELSQDSSDYFKDDSIVEIDMDVQVTYGFDEQGKFKLKSVNVIGVNDLNQYRRGENAEFFDEYTMAGIAEKQAEQAAEAWVEAKNGNDTISQNVDLEIEEI